MTTEDEVKAYRARVDEVKQFIRQHGVLQAIVYKTHLVQSEEQKIWIQAIAEWGVEHPGEIERPAE
jgi:hypothetical protein